MTIRNITFLTYIFLKNLHNLLNTIINSPVFCVDGHLRVDRDLIRLIYSSEPLDNTSSGLLVETLHISLLTLLKRGCHMDLKERKTN